MKLCAFCGIIIVVNKADDFQFAPAQDFVLFPNSTRLPNQSKLLFGGFVSSDCPVELTFGSRKREI